MPCHAPAPPRALVYAGPASLPGCPDAVARLLRADPRGFDVRFVGPAGDLPLTGPVLAAAALYAQPGGGSLRTGWRHMRRHCRPLRRWVDSGGRYVGFCLGAYLAGSSPGFGLLPGDTDTDRYIGSPGAAVDTEDDTVLEISWRGHRRNVFFQDGAVLPPPPRGHDPGVEVVARYGNGDIAALVASHGAGRVAVVGPHPEATPDWFADAGLPVCDTRDLALDLIDTLMADTRTAVNHPHEEHAR